MNAAELLVKCLEEEGVEVIFGVPGEENADFMMALSQSEKIKFVITRHEQGAAFMADVYGRLTGNPAGCLGTLGPGATNLITGVANGNMDHSPMLVLTGQGSTQRLHKESHQIMDVIDMFEPVTKWAVSVRQAETIPEIVRKAVRTARSEKPGAVHIELSEDVAKLPTSAVPMVPKRFRRPVVDDKITDRAFAQLQQAKRPIILAGNGAIRRRASNQLRQFCEQTGIGVISTFMGKGAVSLDAEYCLFTIGLGEKDYPALAIENADLVITLGFDMVEYNPRQWNPNGDKCIIHCDFAPAEIDAHYHPEVELVGDLAHSLWMLNQRLAKAPLEGLDLSFQRKTRDQMLSVFKTHADDESSGRIKPQKVLWDLREVLGPKDIVLSDVGAHKMWIARHYHCYEPNTCLIPNGFCSMGFALPGAIVAHRVHPDRNIVAIAGDGGFLMNVQEMETAKRLGSNIVVLVWEDGGYGLIEWKQDNSYGKHTDLSFTNPEWSTLAAAFGWHSHWVDESAKLKSVLEKALQESGPSLVVLPIDYRENPHLSESLGKLTETMA